ncbi:MAG TPA: biopolymer transporter ExbD [Caulobacteraceae bacterium]|jgi:biopolymer transport protein ExbD
MSARLAGHAATGRIDTYNHDINVTPFVDVMLVLLIVFIIAAPLATNTLKLDLPHAGGQPPPVHLAIVSIDAGGRIFVTAGSQIDAPTDLDKLPGALAAVGPAAASRCRPTRPCATAASSPC